MGQKEALRDYLNTLPSGIDDFLDTAFPIMTSTTAPSTVEDAIITQGRLAHNLNKILCAFEGLTPIELFLRIGQLNPALQGLFGASLEFIGAVGFTVIAPTGDGVYYGYFEAWEVQVNLGEQLAEYVEVEVGEDTFELEPEGSGTFTKLWPVAIGSHTATITGYFEGKEPVTEEVSFNVLAYPTWPISGDSYGTVNTFELEASEDDLDACSVTFLGGGGGGSGGGGAGGEWPLAFDSATGKWKATGDDLPADTYTATYNMTFPNGGTGEQVINFEVTGSGK